MTPLSAVVYQMRAATATVHGQENHQIMQATAQDHHRSHLSCTTVKYVELAVLVPRYTANVNGSK